MSILADRGLVRPLRPVPAVRPAEGGAASDGPVPARREPGSGGPARRSRRRAERGEATRKDGVPEGAEAEFAAESPAAAGSGEVVELRGRANARRGLGADRPGEDSRGAAGRGDSRRRRGAGEPRGSRGEAGRGRSWHAAAEAGLPDGERAESARSAPSDAAGRLGFRSAENCAASIEPMPLNRGARSAGESAGFAASLERGARSASEVADLRSATAVRAADRAGFQTSAPSVVETGDAPVRKSREMRGRAAVRSAERAGFQTSAPSAVETEEAPARGRTAVRSAERAGFQTSAPSAVETEEAPARGRAAVRHIPVAVPANPGRTARERRGEPLRPPSRARVVAGQRGGVACKSEARPSVRWPWLFAIAFAACLIVTGLGVFGAGVSSGPVPSRTASVSVQPGDSLGSLAARFAPDADQGAVVERIKELNNLDDTALLPGMPLTVPVAWPGSGQGGEAGTAGP